MKVFSEILPQTLKNLGLWRRYTIELTILHWREIVGDDIYLHARPFSHYQGIITVSVDNSAWAHHIMTLKPKILAKLNNFIGEKVIKDMIFKAGYFKNGQNEEDTNEIQEYIPNLKEIVLEAECVQKIDGLVQGLTNIKLRHNIRRILIKNERLRKFREKAEWHKCPACGVLCHPKYILCTTCGIEQKVAAMNELRNILQHAPWLTFKEINDFVKCNLLEYNTIKNEIIDKISREIEFKTADQFKLATLTMLMNNIKPDLLNSDIINDTVNKIRGKKNVFASRR